MNVGVGVGYFAWSAKIAVKTNQIRKKKKKRSFHAFMYTDASPRVDERRLADVG